MNSGSSSKSLPSWGRPRHFLTESSCCAAPSSRNRLPGSRQRRSVPLYADLIGDRDQYLSHTVDDGRVLGVLTAEEHRVPVLRQRGADEEIGLPSAGRATVVELVRLGLQGESLGLGARRPQSSDVGRRQDAGARPFELRDAGGEGGCHSALPFCARSSCSIRSTRSTAPDPGTTGPGPCERPKPARRAAASRRRRWLTGP